MSAEVLSIQNLKIGFPVDRQIALAVRGVSLTLKPAQILGIVGESGCGKSLTSLAVLRLLPSPGVITDGHIFFEGQNLLDLPIHAMERIRGGQIALIPQDPLTSLNPVYSIGNQMMEVVLKHQGCSQKEARLRCLEMLDRVGLPNAAERIKDYPHQFSGGMRQRVMIAMALTCNPTVLIADEPTTALDVTVQAQILDLLQAIQKESGTSILLITHDLGVVAEICDEVAVMYAGTIVEQAPVDRLFYHPQHPYTQGLLASIPRPGIERLEPISGQPPALTQQPVGCAFSPRCPKAFEPCDHTIPALQSAQEGGQVACFLNAACTIAP